jgi:hypothetical protein
MRKGGRFIYCKNLVWIWMLRTLFPRQKFLNIFQFCEELANGLWQLFKRYVGHCALFLLIIRNNIIILPGYLFADKEGKKKGKEGKRFTNFPSFCST